MRCAFLVDDLPSCWRTSLVRLLGVLLVAAGLLSPTHARAAEMALLGGGPLLADGHTEATLYAWAPGVGTEGKVKVKAEGASVLEATPLGEGLVRIRILPELVEAAGEIHLDFRAKAPGADASGTATLPTVPGYSGPLLVTAEPEVARFGTDSGVLVRIQAPAGPQLDTSRPIRLVASLGSVDQPVASGNGGFVARWTPPKTMTSSQAVIFVAADANSSEVVGMGRLQVLVPRSASFKAPPGSTCILEVAGAQFGPLKASAGGSVAFQLAVDPRVPRGTLRIVEASGAKQALPVDLPLAATESVLLAPLPAAFPKDAGGMLEVHLATAKGDGSPTSGNPPTLEATGGTASSIQPGPIPGTWRSWITPNPTATQLQLKATLGASVSSATLNLAAGLPSVELQATPAELPEGAIDLELTATFKGADGAPLVGVKPLVVVAGGTRPKLVVSDKQGQIRFPSKLGSKETKVVAFFEAPAGALGLPAAQLVIWTPDGTLPAGANASTLVLVALTDRYGHPVKDAQVDLRVEGLGTVTATTKTDAQGIGRAEYKGAQEPGAAVLYASARGLEASAGVLRTPEDFSSTLPPSGSASTLDTLARISKIAGVAVVRQKQPPPPPPPVLVAANSVESKPTRVLTETGWVGGDRSKQPKPPTALPRTRLSFSLASVPRVYVSKTDDDAGLLLEDPSFEQGNISRGDPFGATAFDLRGASWFGVVGMDLRFRGQFEHEKVEGDSFDRLGWHALAAAKLGPLLGDKVRPYVSLGFARTATRVYAWDDEDVKTQSLPIYGGRAGAGVEVYAGRIFFQGELAETLAPWPVDTRLGLEFGVRLVPALAARVGFDFDHRTFSVEGDDSKAQIIEEEEALMLGLSVLLK